MATQLGSKLMGVLYVLDEPSIGLHQKDNRRLLETLKNIKENHPDAEIIMLSGQGTVKTSIEAMKLGAEDFLEKPVDLQELLKKIDEMKAKRILVLEKQSMEEIEQILKSKAW